MGMIILGAYLGLNMVYIGYAYSHSDPKEEFLARMGELPGSLLPRAILVGMVSAATHKKLMALYMPKEYERGLKSFQYSRLGLAYIVLFLGGAFALVIGKDYQPATDWGYSIERPVYGEGTQTYSMSYEIDGKDESISGDLPLVIEEQLPEELVISKILESKKTVLGQLIVGDKEQSNEISEDLYLPSRPFKEAIEITYVSKTPEYLTDKGQLRKNLMDYETAYKLVIEATLLYGDVNKSFSYDFVGYRQLPNVLEEKSNIEALITKDEMTVTLPSATEISDYRIHWGTAEQGMSGLQIFLISILIGLVLYMLKEGELDRAIKKRQEEILYDFPEVVNKLTILINAGMTFHRAWQKIVGDYQKKERKRILYEEMVQVALDIQTGISESEAIENFGKRCQCMEVIRLSSILVQNMKRGSQSLTIALKALRIEVWSIRTSNARKLGEKASTKLLIPMAISLLTVLLVVIAPTFMKMKI